MIVSSFNSEPAATACNVAVTLRVTSRTRVRRLFAIRLITRRGCQFFDFLGLASLDGFWGWR
jgi:hypothetical protein